MKLQFEQQELQLMAQIIDLSSQRGAFRANEMLAVGALHKKILDTLKATQPNVPETSEKPKEPYIKEE